MNIFLPAEKNLHKSAELLDTRRLQKQILENVEMYAVYTNNKDKLFSEELFTDSKGKITSKWQNLYKCVYHHPVYLFYAEVCPNIFITHSVACCYEYLRRQGKKHFYHDYIMQEFRNANADWLTQDIIPFYSEHPSNHPNKIRTIENVGGLFVDKLLKKWGKERKGRLLI